MRLKNSTLRENGSPAAKAPAKEDPFQKLAALSGKKASKPSDAAALAKVAKMSTEPTKKSDDEAKKLEQDVKEHSEELSKKIEKVERKVGTLTKKPAVFCTPTGGKYHKPTCMTLKKYLKTELNRFESSAAAKKEGKKPCSVCHPK